MHGPREPFLGSLSFSNVQVEITIRPKYIICPQHIEGQGNIESCTVSCFGNVFPGCRYPDFSYTRA